MTDDTRTDGGVAQSPQEQAHLNDVRTAHELHAFQRDVLTMLYAAGPIHGLGLKEKLGEVYETEINHGRLYPNLDRLDEMGYVSKTPKDRRTNEYDVTPEGARVIRLYADYAYHATHPGAEQ